MKWIYPEKKEITPEILEAAGSEVAAKLLLNRGLDSPEKISEFIDLEKSGFSSPYVFEHMEKAVERINKAIQEQESIVVYGDFDCDGVTSTSLLYKTLNYLGANVSFYIPHRSEEGHGLNTAAVCRLRSAKQAKLIITVDCGISNLTEVTLAKSLGIDFIITDHHEAPEILPPAFAIINPKASKEPTGLDYLAGVGVAYKLACALLESNGKSEFSNEIIHLAALGTIADVVPLVGENRAIVYHGLKSISQKTAPGLHHLLETSGFKPDNGVTADMVAFGVAPRINAVGRLEKADMAVELLTCQDKEEIENYCKKLHHNNRIRQQMCETTFIEACQKVNKEIDLENDRGIILAESNWHPGIIGIVASKLSEKYFKPVFMICIDEEAKEARCSARSTEALNLYNALSQLSEYFKQFGGHACAAGFLLDLEKISFNAFRNKLNQVINENFNLNALEPTLSIDMDVNAEELDSDFIQQINRLAPFGECNPNPIFSISNLNLKQFKTMGSNNNHLKIFLSDSNDNLLEAVWWQRSSLDVQLDEAINVAFIPEINTFADRTRIQLIVKDIQSANPEKQAKKSDFPKKIEVSSENSFLAKWVDHRKENEVEKVFANYLRTTKKSALIFAENPDTIRKLETNPILKPKIVNRFNVNKADQLMLFDLPADLNVLSRLMKESEAKVINLIAKDHNQTNPGQLIKLISGMLKYAYANMNGEVDVNLIASKLSTSVIVIKKCINLLCRAKVLKASRSGSESIKFEFTGSVDLSTITGLQEYNDFVDALKSTEVFRSQLATDAIEDIQNLVNKFSSELARV